MTDKPQISLVIPVVSDHAALSQLLDRIGDISVQPCEIIVVDGSEDPECAALCMRHRCVRLQTRPGRGHQLHAGAMRSSGAVILFLHADAVPAPDMVERLCESVAAGAIGGNFRFQFTGPATWYKSLLETLINLRCRYGIPYGDQGLFITRSAYMQTPGFADVPLFEEVQLVRSARKLGRFGQLDTPLGVSPRRWERDGWLRRTVHNRLLAVGFMLGISPARLARSYAGRPHKRPARC